MAEPVFISDRKRTLEERKKSLNMELKRILKNENRYEKIHSINKDKLQNEKDLKFYKKGWFSEWYYSKEILEVEKKTSY